MKNENKGSFIRLKSEFHFFELFLLKNNRSFPLSIPQTLLITDGVIKAWLFNSKQLKSHEILIKKPDKLTFPLLFKEFLSNSDEEILKFELSPSNSSLEKIYSPIAFIEFIQMDSQLVKNTKILNKYEFFQTIQEKKQQLKIVQNYILSPRKNTKYTSHETFFCELRQTDGKFLSIVTKKFTIFEKPFENPHCEEYILESFGKNTEKKSKTSKIIISKSLDNKLNEKIEGIMRSLYDVLRIPEIRVRKCIGKFLLDSEGRVLFKGLSEVYIEMQGKLRELIEKDEIDYEFLHENRVPKVLKQGKKIKGNFKRLYSNNLRGKLMEEECQGDFCDYIAVKQFKGGLEELPSSKYLTEEQKTNYNRNKELFFENYSPKQPYQISNLLLKKIYENKSFVEATLKEYCIIPKSSHLKESENPGLFSEFSIAFKENHKLNKKNLVRFVKICTNCFSIYNFLHQKLESSQRNQLISPSLWIHREKRFSNTFNESLKVKAEIQKPKTSQHTLRNTIDKPQQKVPPEYSFLKKQDLSSHVLNLGFTSSFRTNLSLQGEENLHSERNIKPLSPLVNLYDIAKGKNSEFHSPSALLKKKNNLEVPSMKSEISRRSSSEVLKMLNSLGNGISLKQKKETIQQIITSKKIQARPSIIIKKRLSGLPEYLRRSFQNKQPVAFKASDIASRCVGLYHHNLQILRGFPSFRISTPKLSFIDGLNPFLEVRQKTSLDFPQLLSILHQDPPPNLRPYLLEKIKVFVCDESTAIPYILLDMEDFQKDKKLIKKVSFGREVMIVCHDFFDNFIEKLDFYIGFSHLYPNFLILLFNYPGQAYTYFDTKKKYNNEYNSQILDLLLFELQRKDLFFLRSDNFRFLGFGNGGNILSYFLCMNDNCIINFKYLVLFNPFLYIDDLLADSLTRSIEVFLKFPLESPELAFIYEETLNRQLRNTPNFADIDEKLKRNPITIPGRIAILQGTLESINISQIISRLKIPIRIIHSQQNPLINVSHLDLLIKEDKSQVIFYKNMTETENLKEWLILKENRKVIILGEGGYNLYEDQRDVVREIIKEFLGLELKKNLTQKIAFIDRRISALEKRIVYFFLNYVEKLIEFTENPFEEIQKATSKKFITVFEIYKQKYQRVIKENMEIHREYDEIYDDYRQCKEKVSKNSEEYDEFFERNEKTLNFQTKKFSDLKANLARVSQEFLCPFKIAIKGLFYFKIFIEIDFILIKIKTELNILKENLNYNTNHRMEDNVLESLVLSPNDAKTKSEKIFTNKKNNSAKRQSSLEFDLNPINVEIDSENQNIPDFLKNRIKIMISFEMIIQKIFYCFEAKNEVYETFNTEIEQLTPIEKITYKKIKDFYQEFFDSEADLIKKVSDNQAIKPFLQDFIGTFMVCLTRIDDFIKGFSINNYENENLEDIIIGESEKQQSKTFEETEESPLMTESNISELSSMSIDIYIKNIRSLKKIGMKYEDFLNLRFKKLYKEILGREMEKDMNFMKELHERYH